MSVNKKAMGIFEIVIAGCLLLGGIIDLIVFANYLSYFVGMTIGAVFGLLATFTMLLVFGILGVKSGNKEVRYKVPDHPFKRESDHLHLILNVLNVIFYVVFAGASALILLIVAPILGQYSFVAIYLIIVGCALPLLACIEFHVLNLLIRYHARSDYLRIEQLFEIKKNNHY